MTGKTVGVVARIKTVSKMCKSSHCIFYRHALAVKRMPNALKSVLDNAVEIVNFIKERPLNSRLFKLLCNDMGSEYETLIFQTEVRWLSPGKVLMRVFQLSEEIAIFLSEKETSLANYFSDVSWLQQLAYLADVFNKLNEFNLSMQGRSITVLTAEDKVASMKLKLKSWYQHVQQNKFDCSDTMN
jgi:hypothetical protein